MSKREGRKTDGGELRHRAEERFAAGGTGPLAGHELEAPETQRLLHELQVHQIELEMQNEELERARLEVEEGLAQFTDLYEHAPVGYLTLDRAGEIRRVNLTGAALLGQQRSHLAGRRLALLLTAAGHSTLDDFLAQVFGSQTKQTCEVALARDRAPPMVLELSGTTSADGQECRVVATDVTQRKQHERVARLRSQRVQALVHLFQHPAVPEAEIIAVGIGSLVAFTQSELGFLGLVDATETTMLARVGPQQALRERRLATPMLLEVARGGQWGEAVRQRQAITANDCAAPHSQQTGFPASDSALTRFLAVPLVREGRVLLVAGLANKVEAYNEEDQIETTVFLEGLWEILSRRRAEEQRLSSETKFRTLYESANDAVMLLDEKSIFECNPATLTMFGAGNSAQVCGKHPAELSPPAQPDGADSRVLLNRHIATALHEGRREFDWTHERIDTGETFSANVLFSRMSLDGRQVLQATARDTTEHKRLHASVAQADRLASMGMLAAGVAHEINNPLSYVLYHIASLAQELPSFTAAVQRCCDALRERVGTEAFAAIAGPEAHLLQPTSLASAIHHATEALDGTHRIKDVVRGLGTFSRVEQVELARVDPRQAIESAINMATNEIKYRARLVKELHEVPWLWASEGKLAQVFLNLLINAAHAIDEGQVEQNEIRVRTWAEGDLVFAEIADTGPGIPTQDLERIFEPFFTTKGAGSGTGLGLTICRNIVTELGGEISVDSEVGRGTRFLIRLPVKSRLPKMPAAAVAVEMPRVPAVRGRILVIDDEPAVLSVLQRVLSPGHEVVTAPSGVAARGILEQDPRFDVILCDLMMPQMTGMDLHQWLAERAPTLAARVVFITGGAFTPRAAEYLAKAGNLKIDKPFDPANLLKLITTLVVAAKAHPPPSAV